MGTNRQAGFTLLELSTVFTIAIMLIGGVFLERDMIRAAGLRAMNTQLNEYIAAVHTFRTKYHCLPGDCLTATDYFETYDSAHPDCNESLGLLTYPMTSGKAPGVPTCNGNGDGRIDLPESPVLWQHLADARLVAGAFSGALFSSEGLFCVAHYSCPAIPRTDFGWFVRDSLSLDASLLPGDYGAIAVAWPPRLLDLDELDQFRFMSAGDQRRYDQKFDDGMPATGVVQALDFGVDTGCFVDNGDGPVYVVTETAGSIPNCILSMTLGSFQ